MPKQETKPILLVDDEIHILESFSVMLRSSGLKQVITIDDSRRVPSILEEQPVSLVVLDLSMPFVTGEELLSKITQDYPELPVIIVTATNEIDKAVECMKNGANDYLVKPVEKSRFISAIKKALEISYLKNEVTSLKHYLLTDDLRDESAFENIISVSKKMHAIFKYIEVIADSPFPVLIIGETGVGKELISKSIHASSSYEGKFVAVNVAGLDDTMFSDTLFGHKKGAFTGADTHRDGLISQAAGGTLFLDEIGDLNHQSQVKLLRLIQEKEYYQLGSDIPKKSDARIIVASNRDLKGLVGEGKFRKDLFFRLSAHQINIPPLKERPEDIPHLLDHFLSQAAQSLKKKKPTPPPELSTLLSTYEFPGNVRELETLVYDAASRHTSGILSMDTFKKVIEKERESSPSPIKSSQDHDEPLPMFLNTFPTLKQAEAFLIEQALRKANNNQGIAASLLGITRQALNKRLIRQKKSEE